MLLVAQLAERQIVTLDAVGSSPTFQPNCAKAQNLPNWSVMRMKVQRNFKSEDSPTG